MRMTILIEKGSRREIHGMIILTLGLPLRRYLGMSFIQPRYLKNKLTTCRGS